MGWISGIIVMIAIYMVWRLVLYEEPFSKLGFRRDSRKIDMFTDIFAGCNAGATATFTTWNALPQSTPRLIAIFSSAVAFGAVALIVYSIFKASRHEKAWIVPWAEDEMRIVFIQLCIVAAIAWRILFPIFIVWLAVPVVIAAAMISTVLVVWLHGREWPFWTAEGRARARGESKEDKNMRREKEERDAIRRRLKPGVRFLAYGSFGNIIEGRVIQVINNDTIEAFCKSKLEPKGERGSFPISRIFEILE